MRSLILYVIASASIGSGIACLTQRETGFEDVYLQIKQNVPPIKYTKPKDLQFSGGDIISCMISGFAMHVLLATSSTKVIHAPGTEGGVKEGATRIVHQPYTIATEGRYDSCGVITAWYDNRIRYSCHGDSWTPPKAEEVIERAMVSVDQFYKRNTTYDSFKCNCEHWVTSWRYGLAMSLQVIGRVLVLGDEYAKLDCEAPGKKSCTT